MLLALKYRPRRFDDISGQAASKLVLAKMVQLDRVPAGLLFSGRYGSGKTTAARILGAALNCAEDDRPCGKCRSCEAIRDQVSTDVIEIDAASNGGVASIRELTDSLIYRTSGLNRVVIIDEAHSMSREAYDALLKILEDCPPATTFILATTAPQRLPDTIRSRLMTFEFRMISIEDMVDRLAFIVAQEQIEIDAPLLEIIAERSDGSLRDAIMTLDQCARVDISSVAEFEAAFCDPDFGPELVGHMISGDVSKVLDFTQTQLRLIGSPDAIAETVIATLTSLMVLHAGGVLALQGPPLESREALAARCEAPRAFGALRVIWELRTRTRVGEDPRIALDLALVMATEALSGKFHTKALTKPVERMSLKEMGSV